MFEVGTMPLSLPTPLRSRRSSQKAAHAVQVWVSPDTTPSWPQRVARLLMVSLGLSGAIVLGIGGVWMGGTLLLRPHPPAWLTRYFPQHGSRWGTEPPQSWAEITADLQAQGQKAGTLLALDTITADPNVTGLWLLPVLETRTPCTENCDIIVALRLYGEHRQTADGPELQPLDAITIRAPIASTVMEPLSQAGLGQLTSTQALPLTELVSLERATEGAKKGATEGAKKETPERTPLPGGWLTLTGDWRENGSSIRYGQVIHIDAQGLTVRALMNWSSPPRQLPYWRNLDQQGLPELVVNQSVGLEPALQVYTIAGFASPLFSLRLARVDLQEAAVHQAPAQAPYNTALHLARHGLWNEAQRRLASLKQQHPSHWSLAAERQLSLVALHGKLTQTQAERNWSQPSQKLLSLLIDGRWQLALALLKAEDTGLQRTVLPLLRQDTTGRLWRRITATLQVNPRQPEARLWGALLLLAQQDQTTAETWFKQGKPSQNWVNQFIEIATRLNGLEETVTVANRPALPNGGDRPASPNLRIQGWIGTVTALRGVQIHDWYPEAETFALSTGQQWYQVRVNRSWVEGQWQVLTPSQSDAELWDRLGSSPTLQLLNPEGNAAGTTITVVAIQQQGNHIQLLGTGPFHASDSGGPWLGVSPGQFRPFQNIARQPFTTVYHRYPEARATLGQLLGGEAIQSAADIAEDRIPGHSLTVQLLDLTGDGQAEMVVSPESDGVAIVDGQGQILFQGQTGAVLLGGLLNGDGSHTLVTRVGDQYRFHDWSLPRQRFD